MKLINWSLAISISAPAFLLMMICIHESGHALTARLLGGMNSEVYIWPGYQLYPNFGEKYWLPWPEGSLGFTNTYPAVPLRPIADYLNEDNTLHIFRPFNNFFDLNSAVRNPVMFMGSGLTLLASFVSLLLISIFKPRSILLWPLVLGSLLHIDMLTYAIFPTFLGLPHLVFWGGASAEPVQALLNADVPLTFSIPLIILLSMLEFYWLYWLLMQTRRDVHQEAAV